MRRLVCLGFSEVLFVTKASSTRCEMRTNSASVFSIYLRFARSDDSCRSRDLNCLRCTEEVDLPSDADTDSMSSIGLLV